MKKAFISLHDQATELRYPENFQKHIELLFGPQTRSPTRVGHVIFVREIGPGRYTITGDTEKPAGDGLSLAELFDALLEAVVHSLIDKLDSAVALHAASIGWGGKSIVIPGPSGAGKTSLAAWFVANDFEFLTDELVVLPEVGRTTLSFPRPLLAKLEAEELIAILARSGRSKTVRTAANVLVCRDSRSPSGEQRRQAGLIIFPQFISGSELNIEPVSPAMTGLKLMECNLNARNLADDGLRMLAAFARGVPALALTYGSYEQLDGVADTLVKFVVESGIPAIGLRKLISAFGSRSYSIARGNGDAAKTPSSPAVVPSGGKIPEPSPRQEPKKLTIGMATYDDYDGVYFTLQAIRLYHPEILNDTELLVIDNHPDGPCAQPLKGLDYWIPNYRYVPKGEISGTAIRDWVFQEACGEFVLCIDCHVFIVPGALKRLMDYFDARPDSSDLLQGPMIYDDLKSYSTHFKPGWQAGMYGTWDVNPAGADPNEPPFEIPMQGLGLFACRREAWPGFNPAFRGFGGEEGYIHEKFRQRGGKALCLPFLRWMHRFNRPFGTRYANQWEDRVRNYLIGFRELGWDTAPVVDHFQTFLDEQTWQKVAELLGEELLSPALARPDAGATRREGASQQSLQAALELTPPEPTSADDAGTTVVGDPFASVWDDASLAQQRRLLRRALAIAGSRNIALYLYWGTLLGHVREGAILPWDDDVDFALFETDRVAELRAALEEDGLRTHALSSVSEAWIKVFDPTYAPALHPLCAWTWPYIDIFMYATDEKNAEGSFPVLAYPHELILPGRATTFEGARCWEPERPLAVLDLQYADWRDCEVSPPYSHRREQLNVSHATRRIVTDVHGRKVRQA